MACKVCCVDDIYLHVKIGMSLAVRVATAIEVLLQLPVHWYCRLSALAPIRATAMALESTSLGLPEMRQPLTFDDSLVGCPSGRMLCSQRHNENTGNQIAVCY